MGYDRATRSNGAAITSSTSSVTIRAANDSRKGLTVYNDSTSVLYLKKGSTASSTDFFVKLAASGGFYEFPQEPIWEGIVTGIWASANGFAYVSEDT